MTYFGFGPATTINMKRIITIIIVFLSGFSPFEIIAQNTIDPARIEFKRQAVQRFISDPAQSILLSRLDPSSVEAYLRACKNKSHGKFYAENRG
jgi:hypothetical protein